MPPVAVRILHPASSPMAGPLERALATARSANAERLANLFRSAGADDVRIDEGPPDGRSFGERLRGLTAGLADGAGLVVLGSGSIPLASRADAADLLAVAGSGERRALANNRFSADVIGIGAAAALASVPDLPSDNALPRWLDEVGGFEVADLRRRWRRLAIDLDSPLDALLTSGPSSVGADVDTGLVVDRIDRLRVVAADRRAELTIAGRTSAATLRWLERHTASRTRALVEERGLRAIGLVGSNEPGLAGGADWPAGAGLASGARDPASAAATPRRTTRPPRSVLGLVLDDRGPKALGAVLAELGDGAIVDSRVLLAHRLGADESSWPAPEDRFASDLLLADWIRDPWLRALTASARDSAIPVLLGGHTLAGPGVRMLLGRRR